MGLIPFPPLPGHQPVLAMLIKKYLGALLPTKCTSMTGLFRLTRVFAGNKVNLIICQGMFIVIKPLKRQSRMQQTKKAAKFEDALYCKL